MGSAALSLEADQFFTATPPLLGKVVRVQATSATTGAALVDLSHDTTGLTPEIVGKLVEVWADADVVIALHSSDTATIAAAGALGTTSGSTLKAFERRQFIVPRTATFLFGVTVSGTANLEIVQASALNRADFEAGL